MLAHVYAFDSPHMFSPDHRRHIDSCTALHLAVWYKKDAAYAELLGLGADPSVTNRHGHTAEEMRSFQAKHSEKVQERCDNLIFIDLEFSSGFYEFEEEPKILEVAIVVTDPDLQELGSGTWVIGGIDKTYLEALGDFHQKHFRDSCDGGPFPPLTEESWGNDLFRDILASKATKADVEKSMINLVKEHCPANSCPIVGYSVQCDREVLKTQMPQFYRHLSHQIIDISSILRVAGNWAYEKMKLREGKSSGYNHRAMNDVRDSIEAMRWIRDVLFGADATTVRE